MAQNIQVVIKEEIWPLKQVFRIAHGARTEAKVVSISLKDENGNVGNGECVPYARYGESPQTVIAQIESIREHLENGVNIEGVQVLLPNGAARNAVDCAVWDLLAKQQKKRVWDIAGLDAPKTVTSAITIVIDELDEMVKSALSYKDYPLLKIKIGSEKDFDAITEIAAVRSDADLIIDANEALDAKGFERLLKLCDGMNIALIEQPLPAKDDDALLKIASPITICADEAFHTSADIEKLASKYDAVNVKLDKTGGFTEALKAIREAKRAGMHTMMGCMVGTSLVTAPAQLLANLVDWVDLDGPVLLGKDREHPLHYDNATLYPPDKELWG